MLKLPKNEGLNIVPFIDIMLVLLAIVLSVSTFIVHGKIKVDLPSSKNHIESIENKKKISLLIDSNNIFYIDDEKINMEKLKFFLNHVDKQTMIELKADKNAKFESFIFVIDILKSKQHENFQIVTERLK